MKERERERRFLDDLELAEAPPPACGTDSALWLLYARLILIAVVVGPASVALYLGWRILVYLSVAQP